MEKALEILKEHLASLEAWAYRGEELSAKIEKTKEAIAEIEEAQETIKNLQHNYDVQVEYNNTAYKNYINMVNSLEQRIEAMKPKTCNTCQNLYTNQYEEWFDYCKELNIEISNSTTATFCCNKHEPKDNA